MDLMPDDSYYVVIKNRSDTSLRLSLLRVDAAGRAILVTRA
jgi:hypothetical protein